MNLMLHQTRRSVVLCVIVLEVFAFSEHAYWPLQFKGFSWFWPKRCQQFSLQSEPIFCLSSVHTKVSEHHLRQGLSRQETTPARRVDSLVETHFSESTCLEGQRFTESIRDGEINGNGNKQFCRQSFRSDFCVKGMSEADYCQKTHTQSDQ